ncbi:hypothetical protein APHAL10511_004638 [Amanita phalloides]|nr:hypothetical protein APHAL10511_004638 [Amanita phalloides]
MDSHLPSQDTLTPTTDKIAKFRILVVGRTGTGKSSLIDAIFKASLTDVQHDQAGTADINREITSNFNEHLILHDSQGYEPGDEEKFNILKGFIVERSKKGVSEGIHAIWLCIPVPYANGRFLEKGDEKIFKLNRNKVPIILVFTKLDLLSANIGEESVLKDRESVTKEFNDKHYQAIKKFTSNKIPHVLVSTELPDTLQKLVTVTMENLRIETLSSLHGLKNIFHKKTETIPPTESEEDLADSAQLALATAQRIDMQIKIAASITVGKKKYWRAIISGAHFFGVSLQNCMNVIHKDIITVWNFRGLDEFFLSDIFRARMTAIVSDLSDKKDNNAGAIRSAFATAGAAAGLASTIVASAAAGPAAPIVAPIATVVFLAAWVYGIYEKSPDNIRCLMGYVVDLTLILQDVFQDSLDDRGAGIVTRDRVRDIVNNFDQSGKKKEIHDEIKAFVGNQNLFAKNAVVQKIESLIDTNRG